MEKRKAQNDGFALPCRDLEEKLEPPPKSNLRSTTKATKKPNRRSKRRETYLNKLNCTQVSSFGGLSQKAYNKSN